MEIKTLNGEVVKTENLSDINSELAELMENSGIRNFAIKHDGMCFALCRPKNHKGWINLHIPDKNSMDILIHSVDTLLMRMTENKFKLKVVSVEDL